MLSPSSTRQTDDPFIKPRGTYIALGSNQGFQSLSPRQTLCQALHLIHAGGDKVVATSSPWLSDAWPKHSQAPQFTNAVCQVVPFDTNPHALLKRLHEIEAKMGRQRDPTNQWAARSLDLDLLDYNGLILKNDSFLTLPHPRIEQRDFVVLPLEQVCPDWVHPVTQVKVKDIIANTLKGVGSNNCIRDTAFSCDEFAQQRL
jgi:2-amino-4-hydroxy-6-hydroxymethyldihydropteridine diphosphokinase